MARTIEIDDDVVGDIAIRIAAIPRGTDLKVEVKPQQHVPGAVASWILAVIRNLPIETRLRHECAGSIRLAPEKLVDLRDGARCIEQWPQVDCLFTVWPVPGKRRRGLAPVRDPSPPTVGILNVVDVEWPTEQSLLEPVLTECWHRCPLCSSRYAGTDDSRSTARHSPLQSSGERSDQLPLDICHGIGGCPIGTARGYA